MVQDIEIRNRLGVSDLNKLLYQYTSESMPKQQHTCMVNLKAVTQRPDIKKPSDLEVYVRLSIQPLRVNLDQDVLVFLQEFFSKLSEKKSDAVVPNADGLSPGRKNSAKLLSLNSNEQPVMALKDLSNKTSDEGQTVFDEINGGVSENKEQNLQQTDFYIKSFQFTPDVPIRLDYVGKRIDIEQKLQGLLIGLAQLNRSELKLKSLHYKQGIRGIEKLLKICLEDWKKDITKTQIPAILGGVGPMNSVLQLFQGLQDAVRLPIEQYRKDGRVLRGIQRGANAFSTSSAVALVELTNSFVHSIQFMAEKTFDLVSPETRQKPGLRYSHPRDIREGVTGAINVIKEGVMDVATNVYSVAARENQARGITGAVGGVVRQIPPTLVQPVILTTDATGQVLTGIRNLLNPDAHREDMEKWKTNTK